MKKGMGIMAFLAAQGLLPPKRYQTKPPRKMVRKPNILRNPKIGKQIAEMHDKWVREQFPSRVNKPQPDPRSLSNIKLRNNCTRHQARLIRDGSL